MTFKSNKMKHYPPQIIFLQRIFEPLMQTTRKQRVDLMQGGGGAEYFHDTTFWTQQLKHIFL